MTVAAVYARFSSDSQRDESIEIQVRLCSELIAREGWTAGEVYADYAMTGRNGERPAFRRMREDMAAGAFDVLVVYKQDRLARNMELAAGFKRELFARGLRLVSYREGEVRDDPEGFLTSTMLKADRYIGVYRYAGHVAEGGMPAIIDEGDFQMVQDMMAARKANGNRAAVYMLSGKLYCAVCGAPMTGTSGNGKSGRRYDYYRCTGGCGRALARADKLERLAADTIRKVLSDDSSIVHMTTAIAAWIDARPDAVAPLEAERRARRKRLDALVEAIASGVDPKSVRDAINAETSALELLEAEIAETRRRQMRVPTLEFIEQFVRDMVRVGADDPATSRLLVDAYVDRIYAADPADRIALCFSFDGPGTWDEVDLDGIRDLIENETPENRSSTGVCVSQRWWSRVDPARTPSWVLLGSGR